MDFRNRMAGSFGASENVLKGLDELLKGLHDSTEDFAQSKEQAEKRSKMLFFNGLMEALSRRTVAALGLMESFLLVKEIADVIHKHNLIDEPEICTAALAQVAVSMWIAKMGTNPLKSDAEESKCVKEDGEKKRAAAL